MPKHRVRPARKGTVVIAIPSRGECASHFARTLADLVLWDARYGRRHLDAERPIIWTVGAAQIVQARNTLVRQFLADSRGDWLLMLDDDQVHPRDLLEFLVEAADPSTRPIVGVPVWRFAGGDDGRPRVTHNVLDLDESGAFVEFAGELPPNSLVQVPAIGTGCLMVHRSALVAIRDWSAGNGFGTNWAWFRHHVWPHSDQAEGEDLWFCRVAAAAGLPVFALTIPTLGHVKQVILDGDLPAGAVRI